MKIGTTCSEVCTDMYETVKKRVKDYQAGILFPIYIDSYKESDKKNKENRKIDRGEEARLHRKYGYYCRLKKIWVDDPENIKLIMGSEWFLLDEDRYADLRSEFSHRHENPSIFYRKMDVCTINVEIWGKYCDYIESSRDIDKGIKNLIQRVKNTQKDNFGKDQQISELQSNLQKKKLELEKIQNAFEISTSLIQSLQELVSRSEDQIENLLEENKKLKDFQEQSLRLSEEIKILKTHNDSLVLKIQSLESIRSDFTGMGLGEFLELRAIAEKFETLQKENLELTQKLETRGARIERLRTKNENKTSTIETLKETEIKLNLEKEKLRERILLLEEDKRNFDDSKLFNKISAKSFIILLFGVLTCLLFFFAILIFWSFFSEVSIINCNKFQNENDCWYLSNKCHWNLVFNRCIRANYF